MTIILNISSTTKRKTLTPVRRDKSYGQMVHGIRKKPVVVIPYFSNNIKHLPVNHARHVLNAQDLKVPD